MNIVGKFDDSSIALEGTAETLRELARSIRDSTKSAAIGEHLLMLPLTPPTPYSGYIRSIRVVKSAGNVCISRVERKVLISGLPEKLAVLAATIDHLATHRLVGPHSRKHVHIEFHPEHFYLLEESIPLVVTLLASKVQA